MAADASKRRSNGNRRRAGPRARAAKPSRSNESPVTGTADAAACPAVPTAGETPVATGHPGDTDPIDGTVPAAVRQPPPTHVAAAAAAAPAPDPSPPHRDPNARSAGRAAEPAWDRMTVRSRSTPAAPSSQAASALPRSMSSDGVAAAGGRFRNRATASTSGRAIQGASVPSQPPPAPHRQSHAREPAARALSLLPDAKPRL